MMFVDWNKELSILAQRLADQCLFAHDECRATVHYPYAGQACGEVRWRKSSKTVDLTAIKAIGRVLDAWWGERRKVDPEQLITPFRLSNEAESDAWGHFSQLAVWSLRAVGCGAVIHGTDSSKLLLVCDFSHTNMLGQKTLKAGPLAPCPYNTVRKANSPYFLLCTNVRYITTVDDTYSKTYRELLPSTTEPSSPENYEFAEDPEQEKVHNKEVTSKCKENNDKYKIDHRLEAPEEGTSGICSEEEDSEEVTEDYEATHAVQPRRTLHTIRKSLDYDSRITSSVIEIERTSGRLTLRKPNENAQRLKQIYKDSSDHRRYRLEKALVTENHDEDHYMIMEQLQRHKWQHTRSRYERPGAKALLLTSAPVKPTIRTRSSVKVSLMMDKEDIEQLFRDTGFSLKWKSNNYN